LKQTVLIVGAGGQLGRELAATAPARVACVALPRDGLDIADAAAVADCLARIAPVQVINAAAYTAVDGAESEPEQAHRANALGPGNLARACAECGARLLHVSTDFVFDGRSPSPYAPDATAHPLGAYGRSKLAGEVAVREELPGALVLRSGWIYSRFGHNFVKTMLRLQASRDELAVVADQAGTPTWARSLALALWAAAERPALAGTYHWSDAGICSWYDFAVAIQEEALALGLLERCIPIRPIATAEYPTPARRPAYSVLDKRASWRDLALEAVHWRRQLRTMLADFKEHGDE